MRIIQVQGLVGGGGAEVHTSILCRGLRERGHEVLLCIPDQDHWMEKEALSIGCEVVRFRMVPTWRRLFDFGAGRLLAAHAERFRADVIHSHIWNADVMSYYAKSLTRVPIVSTLHGPTISVSIEKKLIHRIHHRLYSLILRRFDRIIAISSFVRAFVSEDLRIPAERIDVVHNCSDVSLYRGSVDRRAVRARVGISENATVLIIVGELSPRKGILEFIRSASSIGRQVPDAIFLVVGRGILLDEAKALARAGGIESQTRFVGQRADVPDLMRASDALAVTSYQEGFGRTITEAMSSALPVVSFDSGATGEIIVDGETGLLVPEGDIESFAAACVRIMESPTLRDSMGRAGLARALENFDVGPFVAKTEAILFEASQSRSRAR